MLQRIAFIARKEFQYFWKDWESYLWTFAIPLLFMYFIGTVTGQMGGAGGPAARDPLTLIVEPEGGFLVDALVTRSRSRATRSHGPVPLQKRIRRVA